MTETRELEPDKPRAPSPKRPDDSVAADRASMVPETAVADYLPPDQAGPDRRRQHDPEAGGQDPGASGPAS